MQLTFYQHTYILKIIALIHFIYTMFIIREVNKIIGN